MNNNIKYLAESENFKVISEFETVTLLWKKEKSKKEICIGDFYGDPECAIISKNEEYVVTAGCGLIIYFLKEPFSEFQYNKKSTQFIELFRDPKNTCWINGLHQNEIDNDWKYFRFVALNDFGEQIYKLNIENLKLEKISK